MESQEVQTIEDLHQCAERIISQLEPKSTAHVVALSGDLGAGKTALTKEFAKVLSIPEEVTSPTFVVMKSYSIPSHPYLKTLSHIDAYRIEEDDEMRVLRFTELLMDPTQFIVIEWPEHIQNLLPADTFSIKLEITTGETRNITYGS